MLSYLVPHYLKRETLQCESGKTSYYLIIRITISKRWKLLFSKIPQRSGKLLFGQILVRGWKHLFSQTHELSGRKLLFTVIPEPWSGIEQTRKQRNAVTLRCPSKANRSQIGLAINSVNLPYKFMHVMSTLARALVLLSAPPWILHSDLVP